MLNDYNKDNKTFISNHFKSVIFVVIFGYIGSYESSKFTKLLLKIH